MKKTIVVVLLLASAPLIAACGALDRTVANFSGWAKVCVEGVTYLQFPSGVTVQVDPEGRIVKCAVK